MTRKQKKTLWRILISALLLLAAALLPDQIYPGEYWVVDFTGQWTPPADWLAAAVHMGVARPRADERTDRGASGDVYRRAAQRRLARLRGQRRRRDAGRRHRNSSGKASRQRVNGILRSDEL